MSSSSSETESQAVGIGCLTLVPASHELCREDRCLYLEPRQYHLLKMLLDANGQPVSREALISEVWQGRIVSDGAINRAVSMLRKAFSELDEAHNYIETLPKLGYRLQLPAENAVAVADEAPRRSYHRYTVFGCTLVVVVLALLFWRIGAHSDALVVAVRPLPQTSFDGAEFDISLDRAGKRLLYHRVTSQRNRQIWLNTLDNDEHRSLTEESVDSAYASLSPDGRQIVYAQYQQQECHLIRQQIETGMKQVLAECPLDSATKISWQSDGNMIYYRQRADKTKPYTVWQRNLLTGAVRQLTLPASDYSGDGELALAVSENGTLAVARYLSASRSLLLLLDSATGELQEQHELDIAVRDVMWLQNTLLLSDKMQMYQFLQQQLVSLYHPPEQLQSMAISNNAIYFSVIQQRADIWQQQDKQMPTPRITSSRLDLLPRADHLGEQLAYLSTRQGHHQLWLQDKTGQERFLSELPGKAGFARFSWSPDNSSLLLSKDSAAFSVNVADGSIRQLLPATKQVMVANWAPDGESIIYSSNKSGDWQLWRYYLNSGEETQLTQLGGYSGYIWQDDLYFSRYHQDGLWRKSLASGEETLIIAEFDKINWLNWQLDDGIVHYYKPNDGIYRYQLQTQQQQLRLAEPSGFVRQFSLSANQVFYVLRSDVQGDVYKLTLSMD